MFFSCFADESSTIVANELAAANTIISFWTDKVPIAGWIVIWWVVLVAVNVGAVTIFGEVEVVCSTIKFSWIFVVIISMIGRWPLSLGGCYGFQSTCSTANAL